MKGTPFLGGLGNTLRLFFLTLVVLLALLPLWVMLSLAFSDASAVLHNQGPLLWPLKPTLHAFQTLFKEAQLWQALCNSMAVAVVATALHVLSSAMAGYALVHLPLRAKPMITLAVVLTLLLPPQVNSIPLFLLFKSMGLLNTYTALILPATVSGFGVLLFRQWFLSFPPALKESAELEGASPWQTFYYVVLPTAQSPMVSLAVLGFIGLWGSFLWPLLAVQDDHLMTLPVYLAQLKSQYRDVIDWPMLMASATMAIVPVLLFFVSLQGTFFAQGSSQDGLK
jgi:ABC-type glycerol-3-phosphate transport system permease component